ncbi:hypothetical protein [Ekhidna sp. To15]|uniref:hypothetical protein n=1 Tax=Ekhidna sp. To15 TaxID=3395267 RepID=UPI003F51BBCC
MDFSSHILALVFSALSLGSFAQLALDDKEVLVKSELSGDDLTAPRTDLLRTEVEDFIYGPATRIKFKIIEEESGLATTYFKIADLAYMKSDGRQMVPHQLSDGAYQIEYYSVDKNGNQEQIRTGEIYIDKKGPKISAGFGTTPSSFENGLPIFSGDFQLQVEAADDHVKVQKLMYKINDGEMVVSDNAEFIDLTNVVKTLDEGLVKIEIRSYDTFYNFSKEVVEFKIKK